MTARPHFVVCGVYPGIAVLTIDIAGKIPVKIGAGSGDSRVRRLSDHSEASLIDVLEHERSIIPGETPTRVIKWVCSAVEHSTGLGVKEVGEIVVVAVDDNGAIAYVGFADSAAVETIRGFPTNTLGKSKSKETDASHEE
jgi:hypothetical protein